MFKKHLMTLRDNFDPLLSNFSNPIWTNPNGGWNSRFFPSGWWNGSFSASSTLSSCAPSEVGIYKRKQESKKTRTRPRKRPRKKEITFFFAWSLSWLSSCFLVVLLSCFLFLNSHLRIGFKNPVRHFMLRCCFEIHCFLCCFSLSNYFFFLK